MSSSSSDIVAELKRYCAAHPCGSDTLEGIAWWLAMQRCTETMDVLSAAVDSLVEQKILTVHRLSDGTTLFGCAGNEDAGAKTASDAEANSAELPP